MILILIVLPRDRRDPEGVVIGRENMNGWEMTVTG